MTTAIVDDIIACRGVKGNKMKDVDDFTNCSSGSGTVGTVVKGDILDKLTTDSEYFLLKTKVSVGDAKKNNIQYNFSRHCW
jgi:type II secretory pathway component PulK